MLHFENCRGNNVVFRDSFFTLLIIHNFYFINMTTHLLPLVTTYRSSIQTRSIIQFKNNITSDVKYIVHKQYILTHPPYCLQFLIHLLYHFLLFKIIINRLEV